MADKIKIVVAGIGGVGGYFGGLLAKAYAEVKNIEVYFLARGKHLAQIQNNGLKVIKRGIAFTANPFLATANAVEIGNVNYIIVCTKNYDLDAILLQLKPCISEQTTILPLLNGVEAVEKIRNKFPENLVPAGCAYIVSAIKEFGVVENMGNRQEIYFGLDEEKDSRLTKLYDIFKFAGIEAKLSHEISKVIWEKFIFLSCIATATSYLNKTVGNLLTENKNFLIDLIKEVTTVALKKGIEVDEDMQAKALNHYETLPVNATSSMHRDYLNNKPETELHSITGYVVKEAQHLNLILPNFEKAYQNLKLR
jgi:2-dehydropantoate 2-reductase